MRTSWKDSYQLSVFGVTASSFIHPDLHAVAGELSGSQPRVVAHSPLVACRVLACNEPLPAAR
jgi:hypothetical protein